jgi:hypothetical protein
MKLRTSEEPKPTENPEQLLARFEKRIKQLTARQEEIRGWYDEYVKLEKDLTRLQGSVDAVTYIATGALPGDGNHGGMKDHKPK